MRCGRIAKVEGFPYNAGSYSLSFVEGLMAVRGWGDVLILTACACTILVGAVPAWSIDVKLSMEEAQKVL
jgi:hypothetical protein